MQLELDEVFNVVSESSRKYNSAQKYYYSDRCSKYSLCSKVCKHNAIKLLYDEEGKHLSSDREILHECYKFYNGLYCKLAHANAFNTGLLAKFLDRIPGDKMSLSSFQLMAKEITREEIKTALLAMKKHASPGSDGLTVLFYEQFWPIIGEMVFNSLMFAW